MAYPKTAKLIAAATALTGMASAALLYYNIAKETVNQTMNIASDAVERQAKEIEANEDLFKRASQMNDAQLAGTLMQNPEDYLKYARIEMEFCSGHPNVPKCKQRMAQLCADPVLKELNGGPLDGCPP
jgi:energy-coupling factor transporter ATP-binding protein EcfA2